MYPVMVEQLVNERIAERHREARANRRAGGYAMSPGSHDDGLYVPGDLRQKSARSPLSADFTAA